MAIDYSMFDTYNNILIKKRGYITKIPDSKIAIMLISGGLDSVITTARLMEDFNLEIFPLYINRGQKNKLGEEKSLSFFNKYFKKRYGKKFHDLERLDINIPPLAVKTELQKYVNKYAIGYPVRDTIIYLFAVQYAVALSFKYNIEIKTLYNGVVATDDYPHENIVAMRASTVNICQCMDDWQWQLTSPNIDELFVNKPFEKKDEIAWAIKNNIPIENTVSCWNPSVDVDGNIIQCGECFTCKERREGFKLSKCKDLTKYLTK
jgi:7-cyano-7-deazaguanine synthase in queuosine biosynthesis